MKPGLYTQTRAEYDTSPGVSNTLLKHASRSMAHYLHAKNGGGRKDTQALIDGRVLHHAILEPESFVENTIILPSDAPSKPTERQRNAKKPSVDTLSAIAWWDAFNKEANGREIVEADFLKKTNRIIDAVRCHKLAGQYLSKGRAELSAFSIHAETGLMLKSRFDFYPEDQPFVVDIKSTEDASPAAFEYSIRKYGYRTQASMYQDHTKRLGEPRQFLFIAFEKEEPHEVAVYQLDDAATLFGHRQYTALLHNIAACNQVNFYPGYGEEITTLGLSAWEAKEL